VYDLSTGQLFKKLKAKSDYICVDVSEECDVIIAGLDNSQIVVYDLSTGSKRYLNTFISVLFK
jgi:tricorn protease-like protein